MMTRPIEIIAGVALLWSSQGIGSQLRAQSNASDVVVYASELPRSALSEFNFWDDPASPGGKSIGTPNKGDILDPPPENDPHVTFRVKVQQGVAYRCWIHMKVGTPKGKAKANKIFVQFSDAVDKASKPVLAPGTGSYLTAHGPEREGWTWVGCDAVGAAATDPLIRFGKSGEVTVRLQGGEEGVAFDQLILSPAKYLDKPPSEPVVPKV